MTRIHSVGMPVAAASGTRVPFAGSMDRMTCTAEHTTPYHQPRGGPAGGAAVLFGAATVEIDDRYARIRGEDEARRLKAAIDQEIGLFKDDDVSFSVEAWGPRDFNPADQVTLRATSKTAQGTKSHAVSRKIAVPGLIRGVLFPAEGLARLAGLFDPTWKEAAGHIRDYRKINRTEPVEEFIRRAFRQIKQEMTQSS